MADFYPPANTWNWYPGGPAPNPTPPFRLPGDEAGPAPPVGPTQAPQRFPGELEPGNLDLGHRPQVRNPDGSISTVRSIGVGMNGQEILIPTVSTDGRMMSNDQAIDEYKRTGQHMGKFDSVDASNAAAKKIHEDQAKMLPVSMNAGRKRKRKAVP